MVLAGSRLQTEAACAATLRRAPCRQQYGEPVCVLDLVKRVERRPRESVLGCEYAAAVRCARGAAG